MRQLPQPQGEIPDDVRKRLENLDRLIKATEYLPKTEANLKGRVDLIRMREEYLRRQGLSGQMTTIPQPMPSRRSAYVARRQMPNLPSLDKLMTPGFNPDQPLLSDSARGLEMPQRTASSPITFTINVTVNGNANADEVRHGIEQALPSIEEMARRFDMVKHEAARRSFT